MKEHFLFPTNASVSDSASTQEAIDENQQLSQNSSHREPAVPGCSQSPTKEEAWSLLSRLSLSNVDMEIHQRPDIQEFANIITSVFPDISFDALRTLARIFHHDTEAAINHLMEEEELGRSYQRPEMEAPISLKRKRDENPFPAASDAGVAVMGEQSDATPQRVPKSSFEMLSLCKLLHQEYPCVPNKEIAKLLQDNDFCLQTTYLALDTIISTWDTLQEKPWEMISDPNVMQKPYLNPRNQRAMRAAIRTAKDRFKKSVLEELAECWKLRAARDEKRRDNQPKDDPKEDVEDTSDEQLTECQCCFIEYSLRHMIHCEGEATHFFCVNCARRNAETMVGLSKYELSCMSMDKCNGGFSKAEREKFLDDKLNKALDQIESAAMLLLANLEGLVHCPFCDYAAQCPPVEEDREFRCANPACKTVSCRLCEKVAHPNKTCAEFAKENGHSARREIEEAMSAAMIRKCNKCKMPFVKEAGCNKMTCPREECRNVQCYICSRTCDYRHFNDPVRGGRDGNCPLYDSVEVRHEKEVKVAEEEARKAVVEKRPDVDPNLLNFQMSEGVFQDDERRKLSDRQRQPNIYLGAQFAGRDPEVEQAPFDYYNEVRQPHPPPDRRPPWVEWRQARVAPQEPPGMIQFPPYAVPAVHPAPERVAEMANRARERAAEMANRARERAAEMANRAAEMANRPGMANRQGIIPFPDHNAFGIVNPAAERLIPVDIDLLPLANVPDRFNAHVGQQISIHHTIPMGARPVGVPFQMHQRVRGQGESLRIQVEARAMGMTRLGNNHGPHVNN